MWVIKYRLQIDAEISIPYEISFTDLERAFTYLDQVRPPKFKMSWVGRNRDRMKGVGFMLKRQAS